MKFENKILLTFLLIAYSNFSFGQNYINEKADEICNKLMECLNNLPKGFSQSQFLECINNMEQQYPNSSISPEVEKRTKEICKSKINALLSKNMEVEKAEIFISDSLIDKYGLKVEEISLNHLFVTTKSEELKSKIKIYGLAQVIEPINIDSLEKEYGLSKSKDLRKKYENKVEQIYIKEGYFNKNFSKKIQLEGLSSFFDVNISSILIIENGLKNEIIIMHSKKIDKKIKNEIIENAIYQMKKNGN